MNKTDPTCRLLMIREHLEGIPDFAAPPGFSLRWYRPGDEVLWLKIHLEADRFNKISPELFRQEFGSEAARLVDRQCFLLDREGTAIGTGTAWFGNELGGVEIGRVHWIAIVPEYQGRGLSKPLMTAICTGLRKLGHQRAYLSTSKERLPAIRLYLRFGFRPLVRNLAEEAAWKELAPLLES